MISAFCTVSLSRSTHAALRHQVAEEQTSQRRGVRQQERHQCNSTAAGKEIHSRLLTVRSTMRISAPLSVTSAPS